MDVPAVVLLVADFVCTIALALVVYQVARWALSRVSEWRASAGKRPFTARRCFLLAFMSALSFIL